MLILRNFTDQRQIDGATSNGYQSNATPVDTEKLLQLVKSKSETGFNMLYDTYCGALYAILIRFVRRKDVADDLLQDVFVKIWKNINYFDSKKGTLFTWMLSIARNQAIDYLRSSSQKEPAALCAETFALQNVCIQSHDSLDRLVEFKDLKDKALRLEPKYAEVIDLIFFYGCTHEQAARIMKLPLGTVKTRARKGLGLLKTIYKG